MSESIVLQVCKEHKIEPADFFSSSKHSRRFVNARRDAIARFAKAGFNQRAIARMMRRHHDTIRYWIRPKYRDYKRGRAVAYHRKDEARA